MKHTKRQIQIVENFIKNETKRLMKEGNMADFTINVDRDGNERIISLTIHNGQKVAEKRVQPNDKTYSDLFDYCKRVLSK